MYVFKEEDEMNRNMEIRQAAFSRFAHLKILLDEYDFDVTKENEKKLINYLKTIHGGLPLPSGRWGSSLAVALEMHNYPSALLIIKNAADLNIDLEKVSSAEDGSNIMTSNECFEFSQSYFENEVDEEFYSEFPEHLEYIKRNITASEELKHIYLSKSK